MQIKAILIDTVNGKVEKVLLKPKLENYYKLLDCDLVDTIYLPNGDVCYLDDEGLLMEEGQVYFQLNCYAQILAGKALIVGSLQTSDGVIDTNAKSTIEEIKAMVTFLKEGTFTIPEPYMEFRDWSGLD